MTSTYAPIDRLADTRGDSRVLAVLACMVAFLLNHSARIAGFNMSLADPLILMTFMVLLATRKMTIPPYVVIFFSAVVAVTTATALFITPLNFGIYPQTSAYFADFIKLVACLVYFVCGFSLAKLGYQSLVLKWFAIGTVVVAFLGIFMEATGVRVMSDVLYYAGVRYRGFMADPNFWSVLAVAALAYFARSRSLRPLLRWALAASLALSVVLSASKTGMIALVALCGLLLLDKTLASRHRVPATAFLLTGTLAIILLWDTLMALLKSNLDSLRGVIPQIERVSVLLTDPIAAVSEGGSSREAVWEGGVEMIERSPVVGVGIGSYPSINESLFGFTTVAHNTYLQLAAEWGLPLAVIFFGWLIYLLVKGTRIDREVPASLDMLVLRDIIVVFLVGSISLSLNNARMFWLFLGMFVALLLSTSNQVEPSQAGLSRRFRVAS